MIERSSGRLFLFRGEREFATKKLRNLYVGISYFPEGRSPKYHPPPSRRAGLRTGKVGYKKEFLFAGTSYFPEGRSPKYHRIWMLLLLCSEWEEVGHIQIKHRQIKTLSLFRRLADSLSGMFPFCANLRFADKTQSRLRREEEVVHACIEHRHINFAVYSLLHKQCELPVLGRVRPFGYADKREANTSQHWDGWRLLVLLG
jgi:hypothetical protein